MRDAHGTPVAMKQQFSANAAMRSAVVVMGSTYVAYVLGLVTSALVARSLGPDDFGRYSYLVWLVGLMVVLGNNGLPTTAIKFVSEALGRDSVDSARAVHGWLGRRHRLFLVLLSLVFFLLAPFFLPAGWEKGLWMFMVIAVFSGLTKAGYIFRISVAKGYGRFDVEANTTIVVSVVNVLAVAVLMALGAPLTAFMMLFAAMCLLHLLLSAGMLRRGGITAAGAVPLGDQDARVRRHMFWTAVVTITYAFSNRAIETYMLNRFAGSAAVGKFAIAHALSGAGIALLASGLTTVLMPMMSHGFGADGSSRVNSIMASSMRYFTFLGLLAAGTGAFLSAPVVELMYGRQYAPAIPALQAMFLVGGATLAEGAFNALFATMDLQRQRMLLILASVVVTFGFAWALIPRYGLYGAVAAYSATRLLVFVAMIVWTGRMTDLRIPWKELGLLYLSALLAGGVALLPLLLWSGYWVDIAGCALYAVVFVCCTFLLRAWSAADIHHVDGLLQRHPGISGMVRGRLAWLAAKMP